MNYIITCISIMEISFAEIPPNLHGPRHTPYVFSRFKERLTLSMDNRENFCITIIHPYPRNWP